MKKNNGLSFMALMVIMACLSSACNKEKILFEKEYAWQDATWRHSDTLNFAFDIADTMALYDIVLTVKHNTDYPYQNIYSQIFTKFPTGERSKQLINVDLADNTGKWNGESSGKTRSYSVDIQQNAFFNQTGKHVITLEQFMRTDDLARIESVALRIVDKQAKRDLTKESKAKKHIVK
ncbi:MAG: gliding motility lipoprotein GldH [Saprospiraceae bacterium]|nr:gliding motility lipoprotein GldH [Saprospiraceae bacterium]